MNRYILCVIAALLMLANAHRMSVGHKSHCEDGNCSQIRDALVKYGHGSSDRERSGFEPLPAANSLAKQDFEDDAAPEGDEEEATDDTGYSTPDRWTIHGQYIDWDNIGWDDEPIVDEFTESLLSVLFTLTDYNEDLSLEYDELIDLAWIIDKGYVDDKAVRQSLCYKSIWHVSYQIVNLEH